MKRFFLFIISMYSISVFAQYDYYWYKGQKILLEKLPSKKFILFEAIEDSITLKDYLSNNSVKVKNFDKTNNSSTLKPHRLNQIKEFNWAVIEDVNNTSLNGKKDILYEAPFYLTSKKIEAGLSNLFYVKLYKLEDIAVLEKLAIENKVEILGNNKFMPLWYTLACNSKSSGNALDMANVFYESLLFSASEPDLMTDDSPMCVNDTYFNNQWGLNNTGQYAGINGIDINFCQARQITSGNQNIIVAILDQGIEMNHPDLTNMHPISFDTESGTSPSQVLGDHGTACAGIIGANSNNIGISGIAPNSRIMSISNSLGSTPNSRQRRADGINFAVNNGASVISNSWGSAIQYQIIDDAITNAFNNGRSGLGCIVVFSAGNENGAVSYPANSNANIIVVGAMSPCGERKSPTSCDGEPWGGNFGTELDISAPGVLIATTDRQGSRGYNKSTGIASDYTLSFNGTSSACPHVAAVAALILSVNPTLSQLQVANIIETTAQKVGGYNYQTTAGRPNGTWIDQIGYGLVDAYAAVLAAIPSCTGTTNILNQTITTSTNVSGCNINVQNISVINNSTLIIDAQNATNINGIFEVQLGSSIEIK